MTSISNIWKQLTSILSNLNYFSLTWSYGSRQRDTTSSGWKFKLNNLAVKWLREMIRQSVLPTHHASIFPAKSTHVVKMAARIEAGASFSNWEEWNKTLENFKSSHQVEFIVLGSKSIAAAKRNRRRLCSTHMITNTLTLIYGFIHSGKSTRRSSGLRLNQPKVRIIKIVSNHPTLISIWHQHPMLTESPCQ